MNMTKIRLAVLSCTTAALLAACSTPAPTAVIAFNYDIDNAKANGIVQVFDLSGNTVVQVRDLNPKAIQVFDVGNAPIPFKVIGENVVLEGVHGSFTVSTAAAASRVIRKGDAPAARPAVTAAAAIPVEASRASKSDEAVVAEIAHMRKELAELKAILAVAAGTQVPNVTIGATARASENAATEATVVIVSFPNNGRDFAPAQNQRAQLLALSREATNISVHGFTDSEMATAGSAALAKARADAAKRYLMSMGVSPDKIVVAFDPARKFLTENRTANGRAANRRVEIAGS